MPSVSSWTTVPEMYELTLCTVLLTLQKLVRFKDADQADCEDDGNNYLHPKKKRMGLFRRAGRKGIPEEMFAQDPLPHSTSQLSDKQAAFTSSTDVPPPFGSSFRTLQRYRGNPNIARSMFMERHSALTQKNFAVSVEQVSIFITSDNTVICFFEHSARRH